MKRNQTLELRGRSPGLMLLGLMLILAAAESTASAAGGSFIGGLSTVTTVSTTVPANGDLNPYGVAQVPRSKGSLVEGRFLVSNF